MGKVGQIFKCFRTGVPYVQRICRLSQNGDAKYDLLPPSAHVYQNVPIPYLWEPSTSRAGVVILPTEVKYFKQDVV